MIEQLTVKDYILFDYACVDFNKGMSVITGETGAGKSLLIDAIGYLCGDRINGDIVRKGKEKCILQMVCSLPNSTICSKLEEDGYEIEDQLMIQRIVSKNGKSTIKLNMMTTTLNYVRQLMNQILDIHSQMDTIQLMDTDVQLSLLDQYARNDALLSKVQEAYQIYAKNKKELEKAQNETFSDDELDYITSCINEINQADVKENELEQLQEQIKQASQFQKNMEDFQRSIYLLDQENGILDQLYQLHKILSKNDVLSSSVENEYYQLEAIAQDLKEKRDRFQNDVQDLDTLMEREYKIKKLFRKYGGSFEKMQQMLQSYMNKVDLILHRQDVFDKLEKKCKQSKKVYDQFALQLHESRVQCLSSLSSQVESHCHDLMLEHAKFKIDIQSINPTKKGMDAIEFMVSMNPGQPFSPLKKSASGGELSRLMLALKVVFQVQNSIETIIFDEIDTGVSGKVALSMGQKMKLLSSHYQVLCITHLSSVACWADTHYRVFKNVKNQETFTSIEELDEKGCLEELAVMSSGNISPASLNNAKELKERVKNG
ncbi:DNA repair protein RecN [Floccifex sp.]|uniref:DNA repair protein RecN n=1 Tax=Floccifex sp. TaxID=2815810 RepID=UPI003F062A70